MVQKIQSSVELSEWVSRPTQLFFVIVYRVCVAMATPFASSIYDFSVWGALLCIKI